MPYNQWISLVQMASALVGDSTFHGKVLQPRVGGNVKQMAKAGPTKSQAEDQTPVRVTDAQWDSDNLSAGNDRYWEADLGDQSGEGGKKRKRSDDEDTPPRRFLG